jgi:hypothetical protein
MKPFASDPAMTNMRGVFYPTGHVVLMLPTLADARRACELLTQDGLSEDDICIARPAEFERMLHGCADEDDDLLLPSLGTEAETAQHFLQLAHKGHHALIIHARAGLSSSHVLEVLKEIDISYGQRYRYLVIEDLVDGK